MAHSPAAVAFARNLARGGQLFDQLTRAGQAAPPPPPVTDDAVATAQAYGTWAQTLDNLALQAGLGADQADVSLRATLHQPTEVMDRVVRLESEIPEIRAEVDKLRVSEPCLQVAVVALEIAARTLAGAVEPATGSLPRRRGAPRSSARLVLDALAAADGARIARAELIAVGRQSGFSDGAITSALKRLKKAGEVVHNEADATYALPSLGVGDE